MKIKTRYVKIGLSIFFIVILLSVIDKERFLTAIHHVPVSLIITAVIFFALTQVISAIKWWFLVQAAGIQATLWQCIKAFFIGMFVNTVGVGTVGGDIVRALLIDNNKKGKGACLATVIADRAIGLSALALIGLVSGCIFGASKFDMKLAWVAIGVTVAAVVGFCFVSQIMALAAKVFPRGAKYFNQMAQAFPKEKAVLGKVAFIAVIYHCGQVLLASYIIYSLGVSVDLKYIFFAVPFINLLTTLPLSWMGLGLREGIYAYFFVPAYFATAEGAMMVGAIWFVAMILASAIGGVVALLSGDFSKIKEVQ